MWKDIFQKDIPNKELYIIGTLVPYIEENKVKAKYLNWENKDKAIKMLCESGFAKFEKGDLIVGDSKGLFFLQKFETSSYECSTELVDILQNYFEYLRTVRRDIYISEVKKRIKIILNKAQKGEFGGVELLNFLYICNAALNNYASVTMNNTYKETALAKKIVGKLSVSEWLELVPYFVKNYDKIKKANERSFTETNIYTLTYKFDTIRKSFVDANTTPTW
jgi:hypothetical protein